MIDVWNCHAYANFLQAYNGDLQRVYEKVFSAEERGIIARTPRAEEKLKEALLAKLKKCCIEWITKECKRD